MACSCACSPCRCRFNLPTAEQLRRTLGQTLICTVDAARDVRVGLGLRPYIVRIVRTRWSGGVRGGGQEVVVHEMPILPVPKLTDLTSLQEVVTSVGLSEAGSVFLSEVSGSYTEDQLLGNYAGGNPPGRDEKVFYEVEFTGPGGGERRRFSPVSAPSYSATSFQWTVQLVRQQESRTRSGEASR